MSVAVPHSVAVFFRPSSSASFDAAVCTFANQGYDGASTKSTRVTGTPGVADLLWGV